MGSTFSDATAYQQQIFDVASGIFAPGTYSLTVLIPNSYYQIDFFCGPVINVLEPQNYGPDSSNILYHAEGRFISSDNSGTQAYAANPVVKGEFGLPTLWTTTIGKNLINSFNGSASSTKLANWLTTTFPNLYGAGAGTHSLVGLTNTQIATAYGSKFTGGDQQVLSAALSLYATSTSLAGSASTSLAATDYLTVSSLGSAGTTFNVGANGAAFGVPNNTTLTVMQLLVDLNANTTAGAAVASGANAVFNSINTTGNVANAAIGDAALAYTPAQIRIAYGINNLSLDGTGQTIAIVGASRRSQHFSRSVDSYDAEFGITTGGPTLYKKYGAASSFLTVLNQDGQMTNLPDVDPSGAWALEEALDVEWVHAMAPGAQIILVEANSQTLPDLMTGAATAASQPGVSVVSMSWGLPEGWVVSASDEAQYDSDLTTPAGHQGVTFLASTGDYGTSDPEYPAFSANVIAVGGTTLNLNLDNSYGNETGWGTVDGAAGSAIGSGGGTSLYEAEPSFQMGVQSTGFRSTPDVSSVADPDTGAWISDPYNLGSTIPAGGTSLSAPCWAGLIALVNQGRVAAGQSTLNSVSPSDAQQALYSLPCDFQLIGGTAYNMVTGLGTPVAGSLVRRNTAFQPSASVADHWRCDIGSHRSIHLRVRQV